MINSAAHHDTNVVFTIFDMIPKVIHYCWLSDDPYPELIRDCMDSWKRHLPDYEYVLWDKQRFDLSSVPYVYEAFRAKKYAFAADYIRMHALYHHGGIYLDTDVEVLKPFDDLLTLPYFIGRESLLTSRGNLHLEVAAFGAQKGTPWLGTFLDTFNGRKFYISPGKYNMDLLPVTLRDHLAESKIIKEISDIKEFEYDTNIINIFTSEYFSPKTMRLEDYETTQRTYCIHHYNNSWIKNKNNIQYVRSFMSYILHKIPNYTKIRSKIIRILYK
jgi:mannosyltransferase OCH1-like enzyme